MRPPRSRVGRPVRSVGSAGGARAALDGRTGAVLIAGGRAKGVDLSPLAAAAPSLAGVVAIGEAASAVARIFDGLVPVMQASSMEEAVGAALGMAPERGTVILAPACASQDMFRDYRERGDRFAEAARALAEGGTRQATLTEAQGLGSARGD